MDKEELKKIIIKNLVRVDNVNDVWKLFSIPELVKASIFHLAEPWKNQNITKVAGVESRGFIFAAAVAAELNVGFVGIRKPGGIYPGPKYSVKTEPDYSGKSKELLLQEQLLNKSDKVLIVDDWVETGSQALGVKELVERAGAIYGGLSVIIDNMSDRARVALNPVTQIIFESELDPNR